MLYYYLHLMRHRIRKSYFLRRKDSLTWQYVKFTIIWSKNSSNTTKKIVDAEKWYYLSCVGRINKISQWYKENYWCPILHYYSAVAESGLDVRSWRVADWDSMLLVRWGLGARWTLQRNEPGCVVGEHKQFVFVTLGCRLSPDAPWPCPDAGPAAWDSTVLAVIVSVFDGLSTFRFFDIVSPSSIAFFSPAYFQCLGI